MGVPPPIIEENALLLVNLLYHVRVLLGISYIFAIRLINPISRAIKYLGTWYLCTWYLCTSKLVHDYKVKNKTYVV